MSALGVFKGAKILVTGHTGFKGSWLSLWLNQLGATVYGISKDIPTTPSHYSTFEGSGIVKDYRLDICNQDKLKNVIQSINPDFIFHLAAQALVRRSYQNPLEAWHTNTIGTINMLEALRTIRKSCVAIFITSDKSYDNVEWEWGYRETDRLGGPDPYSASKGGAELAISSYLRSFFSSNGHVRIGVGRAGNVIGGGDWAEDRIVPDCVRAWANNEKVILRNPDATRPWQHVLEPLSGYLNLAMSLKESTLLHGQPFNYGPPAGQNHSVRELVESMAKHWEKVIWATSPQVEALHESGLLKLNCDKALHYQGWQATWDFKETIKQTALWYQRYYESASPSISALTLSQIDAYTKDANFRGLKWAL